MTDHQNDTIYSVVINAEEQYSIWPTFKKCVPPGWKEVGIKGSESLCLNQIEKLWTDMRPLSLRKKVQERQKNWEKQKESLINAPPQKPKSFQSQTVAFLTKGQHPINCQNLYKSCEALKESIKNGHIHLTFTDTKGQTCLSLALDTQKTMSTQKNLEKDTEEVSIEGNLVLDFSHIRCLAKIRLPSMQGAGTLKLIRHE